MKYNSELKEAIHELHRNFISGSKLSEDEKEQITYATGDILNAYNKLNESIQDDKARCDKLHAAIEAGFVYGERFMYKSDTDVLNCIFYEKLVSLERLLTFLINNTKKEDFEVIYNYIFKAHN